MKGASILFSEMSSDFDWEDRFNKWYNTHYIPIRMKLPGFVGAQRYRDADRPKYLAVYELESEAALQSQEYQSVKEHPNGETRWILSNVTATSRYVGTEISDQRKDGLKTDPFEAPILYPVFFSVPDDAADDFNAWYTQEHVPMLLKNKNWLMCRRFLITDADPQPWTHLALHYLADVSALDSPEHEAAENTEWRAKLAAEAWFNASDHLFERLGERFAG